MEERKEEEKQEAFGKVGEKWERFRNVKKEVVADEEGRKRNKNRKRRWSWWLSGRRVKVKDETKKSREHVKVGDGELTRERVKKRNGRKRKKKSIVVSVATN